jgi:hypothetical protein
MTSRYPLAGCHGAGKITAAHARLPQPVDDLAQWVGED